MSEVQSTSLLDDLFSANGGEFRKENQGGYLFGAVLSLVGLISLGFLIMMLTTGEWKMKFLILAIAGIGIGLSKGSQLLFKAFRGNYRDNDDPFAEQH